MAGGTIADRGYFALRLQDSMAKLGELEHGIDLLVGVETRSDAPRMIGHAQEVRRGGGGRP